MGCSICDDNFLDAERYGSVTYSSTATLFPGANVEAFKARYKTWRTAGYFEVTSSNNKIIFRDDASTDLEATIAVGEYTTIATFMSAVDAALEAAGASSYTVTQDATTNKFKFTSNLSGGATAFKLMTTDADFTAAALLGLDTSLDFTGATEYVADLLVIHSAEFVELDFGIARNPQACIIVGKRNEALNISPNATIKLQMNNTDNWNAPEIEVTLTYGEWATWAYDVDGLGSAPKRFARIIIIDPTNPDLYLEISKIFIGNVFLPDKGAIQFGLQDQQVDLTVNVETESGAVFSTVKPQRQNIVFQYRFMSKADIDNLRVIFDRFGLSKPFFVLLDSTQVITTDSQEFIKYVRFAQAPSFNIEFANSWQANIVLREEL